MPVSRQKRRKELAIDPERGLSSRQFEKPIWLRAKRHSNRFTVNLGIEGHGHY